MFCISYITAAFDPSIKGERFGVLMQLVSLTSLAHTTDQSGAYLVDNQVRMDKLAPPGRDAVSH